MGIRRSLCFLQDCMHQEQVKQVGASYAWSQNPGQGSTPLKFTAGADSGLYVVFMSTNLRQLCWMGSYKRKQYSHEKLHESEQSQTSTLKQQVSLYCVGLHRLTRVRFWHFTDMLSKGSAIGLGKVNKDG